MIAIGTLVMDLPKPNFTSTEDMDEELQHFG